jgi:hypothetical protein
MRFTQIKKSMLAQFQAPKGHQVRFLVLGAPGGGKTQCSKEVMRDIRDTQGREIPADRHLFLHPSHLDTCDFLGLPELSGDSVRWVPPNALYKIRKGTGPATLILDEFTDSTAPVQNVLSGLLLERRVGDLELTDELYVVCTGNRTEDKSGANRLSTKLGNRVRILHFDTNLDDWIEGFAQPNNLPIDLIQFLRYKPNLLHSFDPNKSSNPTPRSWEKVSLIPDTLDDECYMGSVAGEVSEGPAAEFVAFRKIYRNLPDLDEVLKNPAKAPLPKDTAVQYAISGALAQKATEKNFDRVIEYMARMPREFSVMTVKDALLKEKKLKTTEAFRKWAKDNAEVIL